MEHGRRMLQLIQKMIGGVEVSALSATFKIFDETWLHGARFVHGAIAMLEQVWALVCSEIVMLQHTKTDAVVCFKLCSNCFRNNQISA